MRMMKFENPDFVAPVVTTFRLGTQLTETLQPGDKIMLMKPDGSVWEGYPAYVVTGVVARPFNGFPRSVFAAHHQYGGLRSAPALVALLMQRFYPGEFQLNTVVTCIWLKKDLHPPTLKETAKDEGEYSNILIDQEARC